MEILNIVICFDLYRRRSKHITALSFKSLSSSPPLCLDAWWRYGSPFCPSLFLPSTTLLLLTPGLLTPALLESLYALPSPIMSYSLSSASHDTSAPTTLITPTATITLRTHLCPCPHHTPPSAHFAHAFLRLLRFHRCALAALVLLPTCRAPRVESRGWPPNADVTATSTAATHPSTTPGIWPCSLVGLIW